MQQCIDINLQQTIHLMHKLSRIQCYKIIKGHGVRGVSVMDKSMLTCVELVMMHSQRLISYGLQTAFDKLTNYRHW